MISSQPKDMKVAFQYARQQTAYYSKSFFISAAMLPKEKRWATYALYSFCRYADNLMDNPRNRTTEELLNEVDSFAEEVKLAHKYGESEHPVLKPYIKVAKKYDMPEEYALDLLEGVKMDATINRYETFEDLYVFCYRVAAVVGLMMTHILGYKDKRAFKFAENLGIAMQLTNILRDVLEDKKMNRIYLPAEEMRKFGVSEDDIMQERATPNLIAFMKFQVERARKYYSQAEPGISLLERKSRFAIYSSSKIYGGILYKIEQNEYNPFIGRVYVHQGRKFGILLNELIKTRFLPVSEPKYTVAPNPANQ